MHDEHNMDFRTIAWIVGEPITLVRRHYQRAKECQQPTTLIVP